MGDGADKLMAQHQARLAARVVAMPGVHVRPADAYGLDLQHHVARHQLGHGPLLQLQFAGLGVDKGFHAGAPWVSWMAARNRSMRSAVQ